MQIRASVEWVIVCSATIVELNEVVPCTPDQLRVPVSSIGEPPSVLK